MRFLQRAGWFVLCGLVVLSLGGKALAGVAGAITLNFVNADIGAVIKAMSEMTGKTFVVDPRVKGTINITSPRPVKQSVAYDILLATLRMQGYAAIQADGVVRIVPEADAKFYAVPTSGKSSRNRVGGEMVTRVFTLRHESASQLQLALRPIIGVNSTINAEPGSNTLLVTDYADNLARIERVIEGLDVPSVDEPHLIPLKYASAQSVANLVTRVFAPANSTGGAMDALQVAVDERSNSLIVRGRDRGLIGKIQNLAASLDGPTPVAGNVHVIYLKNAQAVDVAKTLRNIVTADTSALSQPQTTGAPQTSTPKTGAAQESGPGMIQADPASNALIITAPEAIFNNLKAVVEKLDVRRAQVLIEALIVEVSADKAAEFGIQWVGSAGLSNDTALVGLFGNSKVGAGGSNLGTVIAGGESAAAGLATGFNFGLYKEGNLALLARALETDAGGNILSTPTLLTLDNEEAKISVGSNVAFATGAYSTTNGSSNTVTPFTTYDRKDVGLTLKVKPQISEAGSVRMQIAQEVSQLRPALDPTLASTDKRAIESNVLVDDGQIVVLGGLIQNQYTDGEDSIPVLSDIPILGNLFRYNSRKQSKTNLMVFLRPQIVRTAAQASAVTSPRYDYILGQQKAVTPVVHPMLPEMRPPILGMEMSLNSLPGGSAPAGNQAPPATGASGRGIKTGQ